MPTTYAHYRFGRDALGHMPEAAQRIVSSHRQLFDFGVHGPDLLFYYRPFLKTPVNHLGIQCHRQTGRCFFTRAAKAAAACPQRDAARSYLLGVLCHFILDRECHPYVAEKEKSGVSHSAIEASFDRFLMEQDGLDPLTHRPTGHLIPSAGSALVIADFYPPLSRKEILIAENSMVFYLNALVTPPGKKRTALLTAMKLAGQQHFCDLLIPLTPNPKCRDSDGILLDKYQGALALAETMTPELLGHIETGSPLGTGFDHTFGET